MTDPRAPAGEPSPAGIHPSAVLADGVEVGEGVAVGPFAVIGRGTRLHAGARVGSHVVIGEGCEVGADSVIHPHATLYSDVVLGPGSVVRSGACLGSDGFGFAFVAGAYRKIPQVGGCRMGADAEFGTNCTVDRGSIGHTVIGSGCGIADLVQVGHNVQVGDSVAINAMSGLAGSAVIGDGVMIDGQGAVVGHLSVGDGVRLTWRGAISQDVPAGEVLAGAPARPHREMRRADALLLRLPRLVKRLRALERAVLGGISGVRRRSATRRED